MTKDDPITEFRHVPVESLQRNPNCLMTVFDRGGHVEFLGNDNNSKPSSLPDKKYERLSTNFALGYLDQVQKASSNTKL